jgi:hypothetical protein
MDRPGQRRAEHLPSLVPGPLSANVSASKLACQVRRMAHPAGAMRVPAGLSRRPGSVALRALIARPALGEPAEPAAGPWSTAPRTARKIAPSSSSAGIRALQAVSRWLGSGTSRRARAAQMPSKAFLPISPARIPPTTEKGLNRSLIIDSSLRSASWQLSQVASAMSSSAIVPGIDATQTPAETGRGVQSSVCRSTSVQFSPTRRTWPYSVCPYRSPQSNHH